MTITGKIFDVHKISDKEAQIVIRKKMGDKIVPVAINIFGFWYEKFLQQGIANGDRIKANLYMKSKFWEKGQKYFTDVYFKDVVVIEFNEPFKDRPKQQAEGQADLGFDEQTGEVYE